ncbi:Baseplate protein J-like [uncultured Caudovirales phage]|uniref:Baseplate protein J-like n=1 Tax=uncultured Caudovirales phage TaxID=2100421 RepID=A0A6J5RQF7_9CAUD|nr:Baseplate protein J-like [uncultured Caudovirales phage]
MVTIRSSNEIILSLIDFFKITLPDADTKPGTVIRDLFIDAPASALSVLYNELGAISSQQSLRLVIGSDLDKLAKNFGIPRKQSTYSNGVALLTFSSINSPININRGDSVISNNGFSYTVSSGISVTPASSNFYRSIASKFKDQLSYAGISDEYAVEVTVIASTAGSGGNIGTYSLSRTNISGVSNVTNTVAFAGGTDQESDAAFRNRILSSFSGSSVGTALGYLNVALSNSGVSDAFVIQPGDPLMTRDGTIVTKNSDGSNTIVSEGSGGKVDVVVVGSNLIENTDTFIYQDKSNNNDPTSSKNNVVLGQIAADVNKTINRKRIDNIKSGVLPIQPVNELFEITGSVSGSNFKEKSVDSYGRVSGNYELIKDAGVYGGSPWGFDTFHWISDRVSLFSEDKIKGIFNGQDNMTFPDVLLVPQIQQNISITNENSTITSDRSIIKLLHTPSTNVTRVFNVNTGERYIIIDQNLDKTGTFNTTGRIKISGNTLPSQSDLLQVDYSWIVNYDQYSDYDGLSYTSNIRSVTDSIDWGYSNNIKQEVVAFTKDIVNNIFSGSTSHSIGTLISANKFLEVNGTVSKISSGIYVNRLAVTLTNLSVPATSIDSIVLKNYNTELYATAQNDGLFLNSTVLVGIQILNNVTIILPNDTSAIENNIVTVILNSTDVFNSPTINGSINNYQITIPIDLVDTTATTINLRVNYIANISDLFSSTTTKLPSSRSGNGFALLNNNGFNNFSIVNISRREQQTVQKNNSNQFYIELNLPSSDFNLTATEIITVIRLSDGLALWDSNNLGSIITGNTGNYQLILSGFNTPVISDRVLVIYYATDIKRTQPFSYQNELIKYRDDVLSLDIASGKLSIPINSFIDQPASLGFSVLEPNTDINVFTVIDGYITDELDGTAHISSLSVNFATSPDLVNKKVKITGATSTINNGIYDITAYDSANNIITITNILDNITVDNISVVRILDGKEIWNYSGVIDYANNKLLLPTSNFISVNDKVCVIFFRFKNLKKSATKITAATADQIINAGTLTFSGTTVSKVEDVVFIATNTGLKLNVSEALRKHLGIASTSQIPSNIKISDVIKVEKVITASSTNDEVLEVLTTYDVKNCTIQNNLFANNMISDLSLQNLDFILPNTTNNTLNIQTHNLPTLGDKIRITFYYTTTDDSESLTYIRNGLLYTNKKFALINRVYISSGFKSSQSTKLTATSFTQPSLGARYKVFYDYLAPKQNERILVKYNYNKLISDVTFSIENTRPINADVIVRAAKIVLLDLTINVVIDTNYTSSQSTVLQNLRDKLLTALATNTLGQIVDSPTLINVAQSVAGIARARILYFNKTGNIGQVLKVQAQNDEYFEPNNLIINTETR